MAGRTFAIGDIHGDLEAVRTLLGRLPALDHRDTLVFLGDYVDRGPQSAQVVEFVRSELPQRTPAKLVFLRGNHEDAWLRVIQFGWPEFIFPAGNGCLQCLRSYVGDVPTDDPSGASDVELQAMLKGSFFPPDVVKWMEELLWWYEDDHAIYVHAGLPQKDGKWQHPRDVEDPIVLLWLRQKQFFLDYRGKTVICGHTVTKTLPPEISSYTPDDPTDLWAGEAVYAIDTGCGKGGFLTAIQLPELLVYESRG